MAIWEIHPALVHFPIAFLLAGVVLDLYAIGCRRPDLVPVASRLLIAGLITGFLAVGSGLVAYGTVPTHTDESHRRMLWHLGAAVVTLAVFMLGILGRSVAAPRVPRWTRVVTIAGSLVLLVTAYLGGTLVFKYGTGVDPSLLSPGRPPGSGSSPGASPDPSGGSHAH